MMKSYPATFILLGLLFLFFALEVITGAIGNDASLLLLGALPDSGNLDGQYWRLFSHSFLHSGYVHLALNSALLWYVGRIVERRVGSVTMLSIYCASVLLGGIFIVVRHAMHPTPGVSLGASGGVFGLLSAALVLLYRPAAAGFGQPSRVRMALWLIVAVGIAVSFLPGISFAGHAGGLIVGVLLGAVVPVRTNHNPA